MIAHRDTVEFARYGPVTNDENGDPTRAPVAGFPADKVGMLQQRSSRTIRTSAGEDVAVVAYFYSDEYHDGRVDDVVTDEAGREYRVVGVATRRLPFASSVSHTRYDLAAREPGVPS